jgi:hypothetical protein
LTLGVTVRFVLSTLIVLVGISSSLGDDIQLLRAKPDPYGYPRPAPGATHVPVGTSFFCQIGFKDKGTTDSVLPDTVSVRFRSREGAPIEMLSQGQRFADGYTGKITPSRKPRSALAVYIEPTIALKPSTTYTVSVDARSRDGGVLSEKKGSWQFTTADAVTSHSVRFALDLSTPPVRWHGGFFTGFCKPSFCTSASNRIAGYELMERVRQNSPRAWSLQRDFSLTGMQHQPRFLDGALPNVVRERETRRVLAIEQRGEHTLLRLEDFFGHQQYGIASGRPLSDDYHAGDEVLIADGVSLARARVIEVVADTPEEKALLVTSFETPPGGWSIEYTRPLPKTEDPHAPGLFPSGGCYLRKFHPAGTPHYYWGRVDKEWDIAHRRFGRRLVVNFTDAPGDLAVDGGQWTYPKDYAEYHQVVRDYTSHLIERYGDACLDFVWSVFNEPDLAAAFWRSRDWNELQKFYDYTVDAILRSFEDHGYDSRRVIVGGLEIGAIFGVHIEGPILKKFLCHCSPVATCEGALELNAAFADQRLEGKRSQRVEELCNATGGKGSPCDFISVHGYNASEMLAAKLRRAKELALETDAEFFADLWVNSFESCPDWAPPPDAAAADSYLGNGYFSTWCADVARRQLAAAAEDARYGFGETILTFWPWPNSNFRGHNNATQVIAVDDDGDGKKDREQTVALPILHFLGLLARMGNRFWVLPEQIIHGHVVSGFASRGDDAVSLLVYSHNARDTQSRSKADFKIHLTSSAIPWRDVRVSEYRFDKDNNSYYRLARQLRDRPTGGPNSRRPTAEQVASLLAGLASEDPAAQIAAVKKAAAFRDVPEAVLVAAMELHQATKEEDVRVAIEEAGRRVMTRQSCYDPNEIARIQELSQLCVTKSSTLAVETDGVLSLSFTVAANGVNFLVIEPAADP